ncbi:SDR family oxidoreductase [Paracoccus sp. DMF-8]|uniref:SDR family oxidoreductase n=1 Tax=Paracoccus sp. DMF-8 TaxID=3019445 RepID=UPI0023E3A339|nr:SDR family oxidoreductase [Paracoccus sp. DMF-8]MDF3607653.1 SDR family oxidoreductase [Paracoccus sp. DMF-8]
MNCLLPGFTDSLDVGRFGDLAALKRIGRVDEQARAAAFLLSDDSSYITGQSLRVDGGLTRHIWSGQQVGRRVRSASYGRGGISGRPRNAGRYPARGRPRPWWHRMRWRGNLSASGDGGRCHRRRVRFSW